MHNKLMSLACVILTIFCILFFIAGQGLACTGIKLKTSDGSLIYARTLEYAVDLQSKLIAVPAGYEFTGKTPDETPGLKWKVKYAFVGVGSFGLPDMLDGMNEQGLAVGAFAFPGYSDFGKYDPKDAARTLGPTDFSGWLLGNFKTVVEVKKGISAVNVAPVIYKMFGVVPACHYIIHDSKGGCVVLEPISGKIKIHDNPAGVITNSPAFAWQTANLRNYANLSNTGPAPLDIGGGKLLPFGLGAGLLGLPGDFTPPSRFVRAFFFSQWAVPGATAEDGILQAFHILNSFDIPEGTVRVKYGKKTLFEKTLWTSACDLKNRRYYFHTHESRRVRFVDLKTMDFSGGVIKSVPMRGKEKFEDLTPMMK